VQEFGIDLPWCLFICLKVEVESCEINVNDAGEMLADFMSKK
jgi:hypothetical protein